METSTLELKRKVGDLVISLNSDVLELQKIFSKVKDGDYSQLSSSELLKKSKVEEHKTILEKGVKQLESTPEYVKEEKLEKFIKMMKVTIDNVNMVFTLKADIALQSVTETRDEAATLVDLLEKAEKQKISDVKNITNILSEVKEVKVDEAVDKNSEEDCLQNELSFLEDHVKKRFEKIKSEITKKMTDQLNKLDRIWKEEGSTIDLIGLKEVKYEFDQIDKTLKHLIGDWERRKHSDYLTDFLYDLHHKYWNEYNDGFTVKADQKRIEANNQRIKEKQLLEYKNEKKRPVPSWPQNVEYTKFKPDLLSWNKEHHLSSGSSKFGELMEMLKKDGKIHLFEQIQARLGKSRNDSDIIIKIVALLDEINEETTYNKISRSWDSIITCKKKTTESLNEFFSRFETMHFSLNLADDSYLEPTKKSSLENIVVMLGRKLEINDKLKAVLLIKSLGVDGSYKRDILAKVNFDLEGKEVYEATKVAIRDICGEEEKFGRCEDNVLLNKPWSKYQSRSRSRSYSRQREMSRSPGQGSRYRSHSREHRGRQRDRSFEDKAVTFKNKRRDQTPATGKQLLNSTSEVFIIERAYHEIFMSDKDFINNIKDQIMILDIGCPRSLMGRKEFERFIESAVIKEKGKVKYFEANETFRFGPSKLFFSKQRIEVTMYFKGEAFRAKFFIVEGNIPILIGNDLLELLGGVIHTDSKELVLKNLKVSLQMSKTRGGHYVIPVSDKEEETFLEDQQEKRNVTGDEANTVMMAVYANCENDDEIWNLHDIVGHKNFLALMLDEEEVADVMKVHRYFGHRNGRKVWELFAKAGKLRNKKKETLALLDNCEICRKLKKTPPRPKIGMPVANNFNEVVGLDLKVLQDGKYILWMVDMFTKAIKGKYLKDKNPETIVNGIIESWIIGNGFGPGHPTRAFYSDNGGEFLNHKVIDFAASLDTTIKFTAAHAPWQNGIVERNHATADIILSKILAENPNIDLQAAVDKAALAKNSEVNKSGFSALQLVLGQNPSYPGLGEVSAASNNLDSSSKALRALKDIDNMRVKFREADTSEKLKKIRGERINPSVEKFYQFGDPVLFRDSTRKEWKKGIALIRFGKTLYLKFGNWLRRVPIDMVIPDSQSYEDEVNNELVPETTVYDEQEDRFLEDATGEELAKDIELATENGKLKDTVEQLKGELVKLEDDKSIDKCKDVVSQKRSARRMKQKEKKLLKKKLPVLGQKIMYREFGESEWLSGRVCGVYKKSSKYKNVKQLLLDGDHQKKIERDFENEIEEWKPIPENDDVLEEACDDLSETSLLSQVIPQGNVSFPAEIVRKKDYDNESVRLAMKNELDKYRAFNAYEEVPDVGQESIPIRWVVTKQSDSGKNQPIKARLCIRGDLEKGKELLRSDSPTAGKETLKIALSIAANEGFDIKSIDIKSAYLQGHDLKRDIFVKPPVEAEVPGKLWKLKKAAYGILDGGRLFYLRLEEVLSNLGMHKAHADGAMFSYVKSGKLHGLIASHVDDLFIAGDKVFRENVESKLADIFKFSKVECNSFKYCGCTISKTNAGIIVDQQEYVENLEPIDVDVATEDLDRPLSQAEIKMLRGRIGEVLWISLITRPDLSFDVNRLSSEISTATLKTILDMNKLIVKAKSREASLKFSKLGDVKDLKVKVFTDASFNNQDSQVRSTAGKIVLIENSKSGKVNVIS